MKSTCNNSLILLPLPPLAQPQQRLQRQPPTLLPLKPLLPRLQVCWIIPGSSQLIFNPLIQLQSQHTLAPNNYPSPSLSTWTLPMPRSLPTSPTMATWPQSTSHRTAIDCTSIPSTDTELAQITWSATGDRTSFVSMALNKHCLSCLPLPSLLWEPLQTISSAFLTNTS